MQVGGGLLVEQKTETKMKRFIRQVLLIMGVLVFSPTAHSSGFIRDAEIENLLADYSRPLFLAAGLNPNTVGIALINNKSLNAFVANGQNIYFHTGLILESEDPNMVIGVIAHEIGHIIGGHLSRKASTINEAVAGGGARPRSGAHHWRPASCPAQVFVIQPRTGIERRRDCLAPFRRYRPIPQWHYSHDGHAGGPGNSFRG